MVAKTQLVQKNERAIRRLERLFGRTQKTISSLAVVRLIAFLGGGLCGAAAILDNQWLPYGPVACVGAFIFVIVVRLHRKPFHLLPRIEQGMNNARRSNERLLFEWGDIETGLDFIDPARPELAELRIFGRGSAFQQLCRTGLPRSQRALATRLSNGLEVDRIAAHQASIESLMDKKVFRRRMEIESRLLSIKPSALEDAISWTEQDKSALKSLNALRVLFTLLCLATGVQLVLSFTFDLQTAWQLTFLGQVLLFLGTTGRLGESYSALIGDEKTRPLSSLSILFRLCETQSFETEYLDDLKTALRINERRATYQQLEAFNRIIDRLSVKHGPMLHSILGICLGWELHGVWALEAWRKSAGKRIRAAVSALTEIELVLCGCGLREELDVNCYPQVANAVTESGVLHFEQVGHPSIEATERKYNDFTVDSKGQIALITGSNMSGKSTFLRTVGMNVYLAQAGMPVCARNAIVTSCRLVSSIQVTDMPELGLSRFHAEVLRLKSVLDTVNDESHLTFYLIDEMLSGTNSRERSIACKSVIKQLHGATSAFGIITTHDLELARDEEGPPLAYYHFADRFDGAALHFDYQLRPGVATTTNAIRVLEIEGVAITTAHTPQNGDT